MTSCRACRAGRSRGKYSYRIRYARAQTRSRELMKVRTSYYPLVAGIIAASGWAHAGHRASPTRPLPTFTPHEIATGLRGGYQVVVTDLNKDGRPDVIAVATGLSELVWFEDPG